VVGGDAADLEAPRTARVERLGHGPLGLDQLGVGLEQLDLGLGAEVRAKRHEGLQAGDPAAGDDDPRHRVGYAAIGSPKAREGPHAQTSSSRRCARVGDHRAEAMRSSLSAAIVASASRAPASSAKSLQKSSASTALRTHACSFGQSLAGPMSRRVWRTRRYASARAVVMPSRIARLPAFSIATGAHTSRATYRLADA
jgi:hypothetical protein